MTIAIDKDRAKRNLLDSIVGKFAETIPYEKLREKIVNRDETDITITGLAGSSPSILLANLIDTQTKPIVAVMSSPSEAEDLYDDLIFLLGEHQIGHFCAMQSPPYEFRSPSAETIGKRLSTLSRLQRNELKIVVTSVAAIIEPTITVEDFESAGLYLKVDDELEITDLAKKMTTLGFRRVPMVEEVGDFALRGGLIDFFSPGFDYPIRVEFFGDEIDTIRKFEVPSQRTIGLLKEVMILPRREVAITQETVEKYIEKIPEADGSLIRARYLNDPELPGLEWLAVLFDMPRGCLTDFIPPNSLFLVAGAGNIEGIMADITDDAGRHYERMKERMSKLPDVVQYYKNRNPLLMALQENKLIDFVPFKGGRKDIIDFECREHPSIGSRFDLLLTTIKSYQVSGINFFIAADNPGQASRLNELLLEKSDESLVFPIEVALLKGGFVSRANNLAVLTDHQIFGRYFRRTRKKKFKEGVAIQSYTNLSVGDYVVHTDFGIARYKGLKTIDIGDQKRDCLFLIYANDDKLYVPIEEFNRVSKYSGKDAAPKLSPLGGTAWEKTKARTKKAIVDMAEDLLKIYAERKTRPGIAFGPDTTWMRQLEASFPFEETPDQQKAIDAIKTDMEKPTPTDRLICGDVGYGKTEVAVRAAFKAVESNKQVAILVPTTILAQQHLNTFAQRLAEFPIKVEMLSRFRTKKEQKVIIEELSKGKIDIIVGTHRLLSKDVKIPNLGLLVIDEEQRFGVKHKESLRKIKTTVDTVAMTATPIPRTLQMSLMGARDMSLINTSPKDRLPIMTEICEFQPEVIAEAILKEIDRGGQVFFVHNRVQSIEAIHRYIKKLLPQVTVAVAHGQMHERSLEGIMLAFLAGNFQILLCTSIIESGLDIPSVNTIIINRADRFGLAQLYQLRGRVGRSSMRAHAYLLAPSYRHMTPDARKRLRAIEAHTDLGSGFALAMKDLEIRGAGNILGAQQSGFIEEVGFDLYTKLLEEAIGELKGEEIIKPPDTKLDIDI
ncbi:MAG: transcription-repair coupling factor, partial [candidate division Zixibacteria bacterium]|nr:transcription-repair coupling factor [candidate division Zixibacteria bacterium]